MTVRESKGKQPGKPEVIHQWTIPLVHSGCHDKNTRDWWLKQQTQMSDSSGG